MVHKYCFISGCYTGTDSENGPASFFLAPKDSFEKWKEVIPKEGFGPKSRLCWRHFDEDDVVKGKLIGGQFYPHRWRLKKGVMPKHLLNPAGAMVSKPYTCFVPSCKVKHTSVKGFFRPPKDEEIRKLWERAIGRTKRKLADNSRVCQNHFADGEVIKEMVIMYGDKAEVHPYKHWRLKRGAVPSIFPDAGRRRGYDDIIIDQASPERRNIDGDVDCQQPHFVDLSSADEPIQSSNAVSEDDILMQTQSNNQNTGGEEGSASPNIDNFIPIHTTEELDDDSIQVLEFDMLNLNPKSAQLPDASWSWKSCINHLSDQPNKTAGLTCLKIGIHSDELKVIKALQIGRSQLLSYVVLGRLVWPRSFPFQYDSVAELTEILARFEAAPLCPGVSDRDLLERVASHISGFKTVKAWFAATCCGMIESALEGTAAFCDDCCTLRTVLRRQMEKKGTSKSILMAQKARESEEMIKKVARRDSKIKKMMEEINRLRGSLSMDPAVDSIGSSSDEE